MKSQYSVYCHTTPSDRKYVGISCNPQKRWNGGKGYEKNYLFMRAIKKYGWDNIQHEILYENLTLNEAKSIEKKLIADWNLTDPQCGLNLSGGGGGILADSSRELMSKSRIGNTNSVGRKLSQDTKDSISNSLKEYYSTHDNGMKGLHHSEETKEKLRNRVVSEETKEKMRKNHCDVSGVNNPSHKAVIQYSLDGNIIKKYDYATQAAKETNLSLSAIIKCCRGRRKTCGGFMWTYNKEN